MLSTQEESNRELKDMGFSDFELRTLFCYTCMSLYTFASNQLIDCRYLPTGPLLILFAILYYSIFYTLCELLVTKADFEASRLNFGEYCNFKTTALKIEKCMICTVYCVIIGYLFRFFDD